MTPGFAYKQLNRLLWRNQLPDAQIVLVDDATIPHTHGISIYDGSLFAKPIILLNRKTEKFGGPTLIHEMLHVAEPGLKHGRVFDSLVARYWRRAQKEIKGFKSQRKIDLPTPPTCVTVGEERKPNVE